MFAQSVEHALLDKPCTIVGPEVALAEIALQARMALEAGTRAPYVKLGGSQVREAQVAHCVPVEGTLHPLAKDLVPYAMQAGIKQCRGRRRVLPVAKVRILLQAPPRVQDVRKGRSALPMAVVRLFAHFARQVSSAILVGERRALSVVLENTVLRERLLVQVAPTGAGATFRLLEAVAHVWSARRDVSTDFRA
eukprot:TRINITY_DN11552_c0_g1_i1.p2 TRINITY_DN11552_c0_g1~~TRINITY_DN11552_c0_g1_i1.p2  ORF type:complete len:193 (-),score=6.82 TRINITY_DN11552_c0_g1_i1:520-1098(-)